MRFNGEAAERKGTSRKREELIMFRLEQQPAGAGPRPAAGCGSAVLGTAVRCESSAASDPVTGLSCRRRQMGVLDGPIPAGRSSSAGAGGVTAGCPSLALKLLQC